MQDTVAVVTAEVIDDASARAAAPSPAPVLPQPEAISARGPAPARLWQRQSAARCRAAALVRLPPVLARR